MKICHFAASRGLGRGEIYVDLANEMSLVADVCLLVPKGAKYIKRISSRVKVFEYSSRNTRYNPFLIFEIYRLLKTIDPDIVHTHFAKASEVFSFVNRLAHYKHVATKHNSRKGKVFNKIRYVTAVSEEVKHTIDNPNARIIYNGITPVTTMACQLPDTPFSILAIGRLDKIKGFDELIKQAVKIESGFHINIVGEGEERKSLEDLIRKYGLSSSITLTGYREDIPELMQQAHLVVISSRSEGFSITMVESLFYAQALISTRVSGATEILPDKFLINDFNIADKVNNVITNYDEYAGAFDELKNKLRDKFTLKNISHDYLDYYKEVLADDAGG